MRINLHDDWGELLGLLSLYVHYDLQQMNKFLHQIGYSNTHDLSHCCYKNLKIHHCQSAILLSQINLLLIP